MKNFIRIISFLIVTVLVLSSVLPVSIYASSVITGGENNGAVVGAKTGPEDITIQVNGELEQQSTGVKQRIPIVIDIYNSSYIKEASISFENSNFSVIGSEISNSKNIQSIKDDVIKLNSSEVDEMINLEVPVAFKKVEYVSDDYFNRTVNIKLTGTYVDRNGEEQTINKEVQKEIKWFIQSNDFDIVADMQVVRCFSFYEAGYNEMITFKITSGVENGGAAEEDKTLEVDVPTIDGKRPQIIFSDDNYTSEEIGGKIRLVKSIERNAENECKWDDENDVLYLTYIYRGISDSFFEDPKDVILTSNVLTVDGLDGARTKQTEPIQIPFPAGQEIKDVIIANVTSTPSINRGYIISNVGKETNFEVNYSLNFGYPQMTDSILLQENQNEYSSSYRTKSISVDPNELVDVLGEDGKVEVYLQGTDDSYDITKDNTEIIIPNGKELGGIATSAPSNAGNLNIKITKTIKSNASTTLAGKTEITGSTTITNYKNISDYDMTGTQSSINCTWKTKIEEPTQKIHFESNFKTLSTINKNEGVVLNVELESDSIDDYLFKNPSLRITYPEAVKEISNVKIHVLYDDTNELSTNITKSINNQNHTLVISLPGTQTHYVTSAVSKGILIRIEADYTLDRLAPSIDSTIGLEVYNENTRTISNAEKEFKIVAPTEFIMQNKAVVTSPTNVNGSDDKEYFSDSRTTIEEDVEDIIVPLYSNRKYLDVYGTVVNNQGANAEDAIIVGNFMSKNSNSYLGTEFNGTFDTTLLNGITINGENLKTAENENGTYEVYYSTNANEAIDSSSWTKELIENAKSYKIVFLRTFENTKRKDFHYRVAIPEDMTYDQHGKETFALLYKNGSVAGEQYSAVEAKPIGVATKQGAEFSVETTLTNYSTKEVITDNIDEGAYVNLRISITNISNRKISNVKAVVNLTDYFRKVEILEELVTHDVFAEELETNIDVINASETKIINETLFVDTLRSIKTNNEDAYATLNVEVYEGNELEFKPQEHKYKINYKDLSGITVSPVDNKEISIDEQIIQSFYIRNLAEEQIENVVIKGILPSGVDYDSEKNSTIKIEGLTYSYDSNSREYKIEIDKIAGYSFHARIPIYFKVSDYGTYELKTKAKSGNDEFNFNTIRFSVVGKAKNFEVSHTISASSDVIKDTDRFSFNISITNHWNTEKKVKFKDILDDKFVIYGYTILQNGQVKTQHKTTSLIEYDIKMAPEDIAEIRIDCGLNTQEKGTTINLTHRPEATSDGVRIAINPITITVEGTGNFVNPVNPVIDGKYSISGTAWLDANNDGKRETSEQRISNLKMKLIDNNTNKVFVDDNGNEKIAWTSYDGTYSFTNIPVGSYVVVAYYDAEKYGCGDYQNKNVADDLNNDFVETKFEGETVGATTNIIVQNTNIYAIDISLIPRDTFDMELEKKVSNISVKASNGKEANYTYNSDLAKVEISNEKGVTYYLVIEYTLTVKNVGYIDGYAKSVMDFIPKGMTFNQEDNPGWYIKFDGYAYNNTLANTLIKAQHQAEVKIKLRKEVTAEQTGIIKNSAEINETYNTEGIEDINSSGENGDSSKNNYSEAVVIVALSTGGQVVKVAGIVFGILALGVTTLMFAKHKKRKSII